MIFISSFFSRARTAAIVSSLIFFFSAFADAIVMDKNVPEYKKNWASILPTIAVKRAVFNI